MTAFSELLLLVLSLGTLKPWQDDTHLQDPAYFEVDADTGYDSRSLYDLMAHFPTDKEICGADEVYLDCGYEKTCSSSGGEECTKGCFCDMGYVRDNTGRCVTEDICDNDNSLSSVMEFL